MSKKKIESNFNVLVFNVHEKRCVIRIIKPVVIIGPTYLFLRKIIKKMIKNMQSTFGILLFSFH